MIRRKVVFAIAGLLLLGAAPSFAQSTPPGRIRGTIRSLDGNTLQVTTRDGDMVKIVLAPNYTVSAIVPATLDQVKPGAMIGIVGFGPAKQQRAAVISIFPQGSSASQLQIPWDSQPDSVMTNAPVTSQVASADGRVLTVSMKGEPVEVTVPANAVIQTSEPGTPAMLVPGAHVLIVAQQTADGVASAARVSVGKNGFVPAN